MLESVESDILVWLRLLWGITKAESELVGWLAKKNSTTTVVKT